MAVYVFANQKGGVGKTTVTLGVGAALARGGMRVLVLDLDPQASATKVLGFEEDDRWTMADALLEPERYALADLVVSTGWGVDVVPSEMALASRESRRRPLMRSCCATSSLVFVGTTSCSWTVRRAWGC